MPYRLRSKDCFLGALFLLPILWASVALARGVEAVEWVAVSDTKTYVLNASQAKEDAMVSDTHAFVANIFPYAEELNDPVCPLTKTSNKNEFEGWMFHRLGRWVEEFWSRLVTRIREKLFAFSALVSETFRAYEIHLQEHPLVTKSITDALVCGFGDVLAQTVVKAIVGVQAGPLDLHRAFTVAAEGMFISGPLLHYAYDWMELHMSTENSDSMPHQWLMSILQVVVDIMVLDAFFTGTLMVATAILQGRGSSILHELRTEYIPAAKVSWLSSASMAPLQFINFGYVPVQFRVLITNIQDVVWNAAVSYMAHRSRN